MKSRGGQISRLISIPCLPDPSVGGKCRLCSGMFIPQEQEVQDSSPVKGQQGQFMLFFFFFFIIWLRRVSAAARRLLTASWGVFPGGTQALQLLRLIGSVVVLCALACDMWDVGSQFPNQESNLHCKADYWLLDRHESPPIHAFKEQNLEPLARHSSMNPRL